MRGAKSIRDSRIYTIVSRTAAVIFSLWCLTFALSNFAIADEKTIPVEENAKTNEFFDNKSQGKLWSIMVFGGRLNIGNLDDVLLFSSDSELTDTSFVGMALSREFWRNDWIALELEGGVGQQFGGLSGNESTQVWGAGYLRYHNFPWNHMVRTSVAVSTGLNYSTKKTDFENEETINGDTKRLQHYFSPEIAIGLPDYPQADVVFRLHHRSSAWGLFGCDDCGSNVPTVGLRVRF